jgi:hypothetical protein
MSRQVTPQTTLDNLKREAKRWLKALRENVAGARSRLDRALPNAPDVPTLRDVQHALAVEHGLPGWSALKSRVGDTSRSADARARSVDWFLENACPDHHVRGGPAHVRARHTAMRLLEHDPGLATDTFYTSIVCGERDEVERGLSAQPGIAGAKSSPPSHARSDAGHMGDLNRDLGPKGWEPLLYLCFTRLPLESVDDNAVAIARALLDGGADPNVYFMAGAGRYTPMVGAIGEGEEERPPHQQRDALVRLLLEYGADPYDNQVLYNIHFRADVRWFFEMIYEHSVKLGRKADWDDPNWSMLGMGGYGPGAHYWLGVAIVRTISRSPVVSDARREPERRGVHASEVSAAESPRARAPTRIHRDGRSARAVRRDSERLCPRRVRAIRRGVFASQSRRGGARPRRASGVAELDRRDLRGHASKSRGRRWPSARFGRFTRRRGSKNRRPLHMAAYHDSVDVAKLSSTAAPKWIGCLEWNTPLSDVTRNMRG